MQGTWLDLGVYFLLYSFFGWLAEALYYAVARRGFYNRGFLSLPLLPSSGAAFCLMLTVLPSLTGRPVLQLLATLVLSAVCESLAGQLMAWASPRVHWGEDRRRLFSGSGRGILSSLAIAGAYYVTYLVVHPMLMVLLLLIPRLVKQIVVAAVLVLMVLDALVVSWTIRRGDAALFRSYQATGQQTRLAQRLTDAVWRRLRRSYPGIQAAQDEGRYVFAQGLCLDKMVWVFLVSALLGDLIETFYCRLVGGSWMSRSSVLYGPFSFVWGLGAVVLTLSLHRLAGKQDRYVFLGGFVVGGVYEYLCSVFTELVFGTVFWDYSYMPLNIGGRTNVLFCCFWGLLAVVWIKIIYPPMSQAIQRLPAVAGKVLTWVLVFFMVCNALLTSMAMLRYQSRPVRPNSANAFERFLDSRYDDDFMERRWPNMVVVAPAAPEDR